MLFYTSFPTLSLFCALAFLTPALCFCSTPLWATPLPTSQTSLFCFQTFQLALYEATLTSFDISWLFLPWKLFAIVPSVSYQKYLPPLTFFSVEVLTMAAGSTLPTFKRLVKLTCLTKFLDCHHHWRLLLLMIGFALLLVFIWHVFLDTVSC